MLKRKNITKMTAVLLVAVAVMSIPSGFAVWSWFNQSFNAQVQILHHDIEFYEDQALTVPYEFESTAMLWKFNDQVANAYDSQLKVWCDYTGQEALGYKIRITAVGLPECFTFKSVVYQPNAPTTTIMNNGDNCTINEDLFRVHFNVAYDGTPQSTTYDWYVMMEIVETETDRV